MPFWLVSVGWFIINSLPSIGVFLFKIMVGASIYVAIFSFLNAFIVPQMQSLVDSLLGSMGSFQGFAPTINELFNFLEIYKLFSILTSAIMGSVFVKIALTAYKAYTTPNPIGKFKA